MLTFIYFVIILGIIIFIHELGHFLFAKIFGVYVYEFSLGMGPKIFSKKGKNGETEYCLRAIPIGGFVQLAGEEVDDDKKITKDRKMYSKPAWQRFLIMFFGPMNNFILAVIISFIIAICFGASSSQNVIKNYNKYIVVSDFNYNSIAKEAGLKIKDKIIKIDNIEVDANKNGNLQYYIDNVVGDGLTITVERNNELVEVKIPEYQYNDDLGIETEIPTTAAELYGLMPGDKILKINNKTIKASNEISTYLQIYGSKNEVNFTVERNGEQKDIKVVPTKEEIRKSPYYSVGIIMEEPVKEYGLLASIKYSFTNVHLFFRQMIVTLKALFTGGISVKQLSGPVGIYSIVGEVSSSGFESVLQLIALLSVNVGFINLIPFPAFDGGRILFVIIEKIKGSPVSTKVENIIHSIGFIILILLMLYVTFNDVLRLF